MTNQLLFLQPGGVRVPVKLEIFKHGGGLYLAAVNHEAGVHVPFTANATVMAAELRAALALVEKANGARDQGHISRKENSRGAEVQGGRGEKEISPLLPRSPAPLPVLSDLTGDPRHDFPVFVRRFAKSSPDIVAAIAQVYKSRGYKVPGMEAILQGYDDLDSIWAIRAKVVNAAGELVYGGRNRVARALGIRDAGNYRQRIDTVVWLLKHAPLEDYQAALEVLVPEIRSLETKPAVSNTQAMQAKSADGGKKRSAAA